MEGVRSFVSDGMFVWRDEERVVGFMDWAWRWMGVIGMDGSDGCVGCCVVGCRSCVVVVGKTSGLAWSIFSSNINMCDTPNALVVGGGAAGVACSCDWLI